MSELAEKIKATIIIHPGDKLVLRVDERLTLEQAQRIREGVLNNLPELDDVVVIGCKGVAVLRPDGTEESV